MLIFRQEWPLVVIAIIVLLFFKPNVSGDGYGYYLSAAAFFEDHQLNIQNQLKVCQYENSCPEILHDPLGRPVVRWAFGFPLLSGPFFLLSLFLENYIPIGVDPLLLQKLGIPFFRQLALPLASLVLFILTLIVLPKILKLLGNPIQQSDQWVAILAGFVGTPIVWYMTYSPSYSHVAEAALFTLLTYFFLTNRPFLAGMSTGLLIWTRYPAGIFILPFLAYYLLMEKNMKKTAVYLLATSPFILILGLFFQVQYGSIFGSPYLSEFIFDAGTIFINFIRIFLDVDRGMLFWTPLFLVGIYGLAKWNDSRKIPLLGCVFLNTLVVATFNAWDAGWGFGNRYFTLFFPLCVMGIFILYQNNFWKKIVHAGMIYSTILFLLFLGMAKADLDNVWFYTRLLKSYFVDGHIWEFPSIIINRIPIIRLLRGDI